MEFENAAPQGFINWISRDPAGYIEIRGEAFLEIFLPSASREERGRKEGARERERERVRGRGREARTVRGRNRRADVRTVRRDDD